MKESEKQLAYKVALSSLKEGLNELDYHVGKEFFDMLDCNEISGADVTVAADIDRRASGYDLNLGFEGWLEVPCDRCLDPVRIPVDTDYRVTVKYGDPEEDAPEDRVVLPWDATELDLSPLIRDSLLLEVPLRRVHPEGECNPEMEALIDD